VFEAPPKLTPASEFTFTGAWEEILEITGAAGTASYMQSFDIDFKDSKVQYIKAELCCEDEKGVVRHFYAAPDKEGKLQWVGGEAAGELPERYWYDPAELLAELDRYGAEGIIAGAKNVNLRMEAYSGERDYQYYLGQEYLLKNGRLLPLDKVSFNGSGCRADVMISRYYYGEPEAPFTIESIRGPVEYWFIEKDLETAAEAVYSRNRQGPEFVNFISGIHEVLPPGWEMRLISANTKPPHGLGEPLFRLDFTDTVNKFSQSMTTENYHVSPSLRLFFYDIAEKDVVLAVIEDEKIYSWDVPVYYAETPDYITVTSPIYINSGWVSEEASALYEPLEKALKEYFAGLEG
jgi:hypothetical protein